MANELQHTQMSLKKVNMDQKSQHKILNAIVKTHEKQVTTLNEAR
jgi:hypothetical protein